MERTSLSFACMLLCSAVCAAPVAVNPYIILGRVTDSSRSAFDTNRVATVTASRKSGELLARTTTYFNPGSRRNYTLSIPMASEPADNYAVKGEPLDICVVDDMNNTWSGVIVDASAEAPDSVREVDIVLSKDENGDGIDDELYESLEIHWWRSDYYVDGEEFDPRKDYDGDGVSTIDEALSGTNPYDPVSVLKITDFSRGELVSLSFTGAGGRAYSVESAESPGTGGWKAVNVVSLPNGDDSTVCTVYLVPEKQGSAFFRVRAE